MSQFASLFKSNETEKTENKKTESKSKTEKKKSNTDPVASHSPTLKTSQKIATEKRTTEKRAAGKSSNPDYTQVLTYVRRDTHKAVKKVLLDDEQGRDLSDLVEELLAGWVKENLR